eukprot:4860292-Prymnesium_polylepis.2
MICARPAALPIISIIGRMIARSSTLALAYICNASFVSAFSRSCFRTAFCCFESDAGFRFACSAQSCTKICSFSSTPHEFFCAGRST